MSNLKPPAWLVSSIHNEGHVNTVIHTLSQRESIRQAARSSPSEHSSLRAALQQLLRHPDPNKYYSVSAGTSPENIQYNRYADIEPYDRTRVLVDNSRYLNANWVRELYGNKWWIAAQAPLPNTAHAFLSVMLQPSVSPPGAPQKDIGRVRTVVQLTLNMESGRRKAHPYFPERVGTSTIVPPEEGCNAPPLKLTLLNQSRITNANCTQSTISIMPLMPSKPTYSNPSISGAGPDDDDDNYGEDSPATLFTHLLYERWPDHGVPEPADQKSLLDFLRLVHRVNRDGPPNTSTSSFGPDPPIIVGCSAGVGRTGAFIALSSLLRAYDLLEDDKPPPDLSRTPQPGDLPPSPLGNLPSQISHDLVAREIDALREQRPGMVQREEQIFLIYELLETAF